MTLNCCEPMAIAENYRCSKQKSAKPPINPSPTICPDCCKPLAIAIDYERKKGYRDYLWCIWCDKEIPGPIITGKR